jgi:hypothetical protein
LVFDEGDGKKEVESIKIVKSLWSVWKNSFDIMVVNACIDKLYAVGVEKMKSN